MDLTALLQELGFPPDAVAAVVQGSFTAYSGTLDALPPAWPKEDLCRALPELNRRLAGTLVLLAAEFVTPDLAEVARTLLECGAPATFRTGDGWTALMLLAAKRELLPAQRAFARALVQHGCPVDAVTSQGEFALLLANSACNLDIVAMLLESGASLQPPGSGELLPWLNHLPKVVARAAPALGSSGSALVVRVARLLVAAGADPDVLDNGLTPLHDLAFAMAARSFGMQAHLALLEELLALGANANAADELGRTAAHCLNVNVAQAAEMDEAALQRCRKALVALAHAGCDINAVANDGIFSSALHQAVDLAVSVSRVRLEAVAGWVALVGTLLELDADPGLVAFFHEEDSTPLRVLAVRLAGDVPAALVDLARILAVNECQRCGSDCVRFGLEILTLWIGLTLHDNTFTHSGQRCQQLSPEQLQFTEMLVSHCCPPLPWPADMGTLVGEPAQEDTDSPAAVLVHCALVMGNMQLLEMVLRALPPSECFPSKPSDSLAWHCCTILAYKLGQESPPLQGQLEERHAFHVLQFCRQAEAIVRAGIVAEPLSPPEVVEFTTSVPAWGRELMKFAVATTVGAWRSSHHSLCPAHFKAAAQALLLINSCRGFAARQLGSRGQEQHLTRSSSSTQQQLGVQLPGEVVEQILSCAASPPICWMPQLFPFMSAEERQRWSSCSALGDSA